MISSGLETTLDVGNDIGHDFWVRNQVCIDGMLIYEYFDLLEENPELVFDYLEGTYTHNGVEHGLECNSEGDIYASTLLATECLNTQGSQALTQSTRLAMAIQMAAAEVAPLRPVRWPRRVPGPCLTPMPSSWIWRPTIWSARRTWQEMWWGWMA